MGEEGLCDAVSPHPVRPRHSAQCQPCRQQWTVLGVAGNPGGSLAGQSPRGPCSHCLTIQRLGLVEPHQGTIELLPLGKFTGEEMCSALSDTSEANPRQLSGEYGDE